MAELSIYLADDHAIVVDGLKEILRLQPEWHITGTASNGEELIELVKQKRPDIIVMDINMPKMNGLQATAWIKANYTDTKVIILTMFPEKTYIDQLIQAGADGCLLKSRGSQELIEAIARVAEGKSYFDRIRDFAGKEKQPALNLSERELEIIKLIVAGSTNGEVADQLFLSEHTVKTHRKNIFRKLGINSVSQLATIAINNNLIA